MTLKKPSPPAPTPREPRMGPRASRDAVYREFGFRIYSRPNGKPPIWVRDGKYYGETEMDGLVSEERKKRTHEQLDKGGGEG